MGTPVVGDALKILMIAPNPFFVDRGFSVQVYEQARALRRLGHEVVFATYHCGRDLEGFRFYRSLRVPWYGAEETGGSLHRLYIDLLLLATTWKALRRERPDVVHGHIHEGALIGLACRALGGPRVLFDLQGSLSGELEVKGFFTRGKRLLRPFFRLIEGWIDRASDVVVTQSQAMKDDLVTRFRVPAGSIHLTMDGVDTETFTPRPRDLELLRSLGLPEDRPIVVYLGLLMRHQGIDCLLEAASLALRRDGGRHHYVLMGYPNVAHYRQRAADLGIAAHLSFTGAVDYARAPDYLALGDLAVSPKLDSTEANGKLYNYMAMALPTVAFDTVVNREVLGDTGIYCTLDDAQSLAEAMLGALGDLEAARRLGLRARARVEERFSWLEVARRLELRYRALLAGEGRDGG